MAQQKTITMHDLSKNSQITIFQDGATVRFSQGYQFLDSVGDVIESLGERHQMIEVNINTLPAGIKDALLDLRDYLYANALLIEEMEG